MAHRSPGGDLIVSLPEAVPIRVRISDPAGRLVARTEARGRAVFPRNLFRPGLYLVRFGQGDGAPVEKVAM
jgi:hypothetical protein